MTHRNAPLKNLTRWNRTGLSRFDYIDGDASVWLEELRIAMLGLYLRGGEAASRKPEYWRDIYLRAVEDWPDVNEAAERVVWKRLAPAIPPQQETRGRRNERLLKQYDERTGDYAWEINRAFARAAHILLGYLNAYTNEGYLRTATQWDNLRRLAAMVNYQPAPAASATTTVGMLLNEDADVVEVAAGLAMKHTPPEGGAPLVFETLDVVSAHPALNAARTKNWNRNANEIPFTDRKCLWHLDEDQSLATGDLAVLVSGNSGEATILASVKHNTGAETVELEFVDSVTKTYPYYVARLWTAPVDLRVGLKVSKNQQVVVEADDLGAVVAGDLIEVFIGRKSDVVKVLAAQGTQLVLDMDLPDSDEVKLRVMQPFALDEQSGVEKVAGSGHLMWALLSHGVTSTTGTQLNGDETQVPYMRRFEFEGAEGERAFSKDKKSKAKSGRVVRKDPKVLPGKEDGEKGKPKGGGRTVTFEGKPPKGLTDGAWFIARNMASDNVKALRVTGVRVASGEYYVEFNRSPGGAHDQTEFHGPMTLSLRAVGYNRNPDSAFAGNTVTLQDIPKEAQTLIKPGRRVLIRRQNTSTDCSVLARVEEARPDTDRRIELSLVGYEDAYTWPSGEVSFGLNTVQISHGESKGSKLLGSGDGERGSQAFEFAVKNVSHVPSTAAESGVVPDIDIAVDGVRWDYRDYVDPAAQGTRAWSTTLTDSGTLKIQFRRRLVTGHNNVVVTRHRVGAGVAGSDIPAFSFIKPMKKHRHVEGIFQPFATAGGADREPVSKLRESTPQRLSSNGRAVSLSDFEHLAARNAAILRAHAEMLPTSGSQRMVVLTVALSGGGSVDGLADDLIPAITSRALPGVGVSFRDYEHLPLSIAVTVRSDLAVHNRTDIKALAEARLAEVFALECRGFGQTAYVSEVLAALETVSGVENASVIDFGLEGYDLSADKPDDFTGPWPHNVATNDGQVAAIYATAHQIVHVDTDAGGAIAVEVEDIR